MTDESDRRQGMASRIARRIAGSIFIGFAFFILLWIVVFDAVTAAMVAGGLAVVSLAAGSVFDFIGGVVEAIAAALAAVLAAVAGIFSSLG